MSNASLQTDPLLTLLRDSSHAARLSLAQWDEVIRLARRANVISRMACMLWEQDLLDAVPPAPRAHLKAALVLAQRQRTAGVAEIERIARTLAQKNLPTVLLKGAAYLARDLPVSHGRIFGDVDILCAKADLPAVESALMIGGWGTGEISAYDNRYYRQWMHELPPYTHAKRGTVLDVHHNILPSTAKNPPDANLLLAQVEPVAGMAGVFTLSEPDRVLHSACHLFHEGEFLNGLRDLSDLDRLLRAVSEDAFWPRLQQRAAILGLEGVLYYAVRMTQVFFNTPLPEDLLGRARAGGRGRVMDALYTHALHEQLTPSFARKAARGVLYLRGHWLRMPPHLLAAHLARKAWMGVWE